MLQDVLQDQYRTLAQVKTLLQAAQDRQKAYVDAKRRPVQFSDGQLVLLSTRNLRLQGVGPRKLYPRFIGPFSVVRCINPVAYQLALPAGWRIHNVFHVSLLREYKLPGRPAQVPLPSLDDTGKPVYCPEHLIRHRIQRGKSEYLVKWQGLSTYHSSWAPVADLPDALVQGYHQQYPAQMPT